MKKSACCDVDVSVLPGDQICMGCMNPCISYELPNPMTSPNEWWKEEPFCEYKGNECCGWNDFHFNVPLIIEEVKRREIEREYHISCKQCGLSTSFSPNDK